MTQEQLAEIIHEYYLHSTKNELQRCAFCEEYCFIMRNALLLN